MAYSRGYLLHFDMPGLVPFLNYRLDDALPASLRRGEGEGSPHILRNVLLVEIWQTPQAQLIKDWKGFTARRINRVLGRRGKLWQDDYWDRYISDEAHCRKVVHYIESNLVKAGLVKSPEQWPFSSARFRDEYNRLKLPAKPGAPICTHSPPGHALRLRRR